MLELKDIQVAIRKNILLNQISASFESGKITGILGPNGSGKSSLLKTICGLYTPFVGKVVWQGNDLHQMPRKKRSQIVSMVPQVTHNYFDFSVHEIVEMGLYARGSKSFEKVYHAMKQCDVWHLRERNICTLSCGEQQRVYIARSLATEAPVLLLDEPTASLDIRHQLEVVEVLQELKHQNKMILISVHDLAFAEKICDHVLVLNHGEIRGQGEFSSVITNELLFEVFNVSFENFRLLNEFGNSFFIN